MATTGRQAHLTAMLARIATLAQELMVDTATIQRPAWTEGGDPRLSESYTTVATGVPVRVRYTVGSPYEQELLYATAANAFLHFPNGTDVRMEDVVTVYASPDGDAPPDGDGREFTVKALAREATHAAERVVTAATVWTQGEALP